MLMAAESAPLPAATKRLNVTVQRVGGEWRINDIAMWHEPMTPLLHALLSGEATPSDVQLVSVSAGDVVEITWRNRRDSAGESEHHPMHMHGHRFWLLGSGTSGEPHYSIADQTRALLRDTFHLPHEDGWAITRFVADNPGVWMVHCHYAWHMTSGMAFYIVYQPVSTIPSLPAGTERCAVPLSQRATRPSATTTAGHHQHAPQSRFGLRCLRYSLSHSAVRNGENTQTLSKDYAQAGIRQSSMPSARNSGAMDLRTASRRSARTLSRR
jgi:hypothetical protein